MFYRSLVLTVLLIALLPLNFNCTSLGMNNAIGSSDLPVQLILVGILLVELHEVMLGVIEEYPAA